MNFSPRLPSFLKHSLALVLDNSLCAAMNTIQWTLRAESHSFAELDAYLKECEILTREDYYAAPPMEGLNISNNQIRWDTPIHDTRHPENNRACVEWYGSHPKRPTVILLHALMSAHGGGYRRLARWFNERGWNAAFPHLPCHYSRTPAGHWRGASTLTSNLIRNALLIRQSVIETRQLMALLRLKGCDKFALLATSYGGWVGSLTSFIEPDFDFMALLQPIVNVEHAIGQSPAAQAIRRIFAKTGISPDIVQKHAHLSSPLHGMPLCDKKRIVLATGIYDRISPAEELKKLADKWGSPPPLETPQGHFGYVALRMVKNRIVSFL
ncbi:MAG: hypothetical protein C5B47_03280 [Verrucomicrobia bacterium]|nr:MAG: hypothetical protein C5B47_03280 [Verrucomicrobiota bacterium]